MKFFLNSLHNNNNIKKVPIESIFVDLRVFIMFTNVTKRDYYQVSKISGVLNN